MSSPPLIHAVVSTDEQTYTDRVNRAMPREVALNIFHSKPPVKPRPQSIYKRFKELLLASHSKENTPSTEDIKNDWEAVRMVDVDSIAPGCRTNLMTIKHLAEVHSMEEETCYKSELSKWCHDFDEAAVSILVWSALEATEANFLDLQAVIARTEEVQEEFWTGTSTSTFSEHLRHAKERLKRIKAAYEPRLFAYLRQVEDHELLMHCCDHSNLQFAVRSRGREHDELLRELKALAKAIPYEIIAGIEREMHPTVGAFPDEGVMIKYSRCGVSPKVFGLAFDVPPHVTTVLIPASCVGTRRNHDIALVCSDIQISYNQEKVTATAVYFQRRLPHGKILPVTQPSN